MKFWVASLGLLAACAVGCITASNSTSNNHRSALINSYQFETSPFMRHYAYGNPETAYGESAASGAYGKVNRAWDETHEGNWYIEEQRYGADAIAVGVAHGRPDIMQRGIRILDWGWQRQEPDGSFACPDNIHSTAFFVEAVARAALLIEASPNRETYAATLATWRTKLQLSTTWLLQPDIDAKGLQRDRPYTHRAYRNAAALLEAGRWLNDSAAIQRSKKYIRDGIAVQDPSGFNPEKGGHDTSYHGVGLLYAARYYALSEDVALNAELKSASEKALAWLRSRISPEGVISAEGNTRTGANQEVSRSGRGKDISYSYTYKAFNYWGLLLADNELIQLAQILHQAEHKIKAAIN